VGTSTVGADDTGEDTINGFDTAVDVIQITATDVVDFEHTSDLAVGTGTTSAVGTATLATAFKPGTLLINTDGDAAFNDANDMAINFGTVSTSGVAITGAADPLTVADVSGRIVYNATAKAAGSTITTGDLGDTVLGAGGVDIISTGTGADTVTTTATGALDVINLGAADGAADNVIIATASAANTATNVPTIIGFEAGAGGDTIDIAGLVLNSNNAGVSVAAGAGATNTIAAVPVVAIANNGQNAAANAIMTFNGANDQMAANSTIANAVAGAVTVLKSTADFSGANVGAGDDLILILDDGTNSFIFHYIGAGNAGITEAGDMQLIAKVDGLEANAFLAGDLI
jgi:hypothetical protein